MARILLAGSDRGQVRDVRSILREDGHEVVLPRRLGDWREVERQVRPELVVGALSHPAKMLTVPGRPLRGFPAPLLFVQLDGTPPSEHHLDERLVDAIGSPFMSEELLARVDALIRARRVVLRTRRGPGFRPERPTVRGRSRVAGWLGQVTARLGSRVPRREKPLVPYLEVASRIAQWTERRDAFEPGHGERVASWAAMMSQVLGLPESEASTLLRAAMLHDIGKVALPAEILRQSEPLRDEQRKLIRTHPERGATLLRALDRDEQVAETILYHHEQPDGRGYYGKPPTEVPRIAGLLGVAEAYDAMTSTTLHAPLSRDEALQALREQRGGKYEEQAVDALCESLRPRTTILPLSR